MVICSSCLFCVLVFVAVPVDSESPEAGNGGNALYFDHLRRDIVAWRCNQPYNTGFTVEFWYHVLDPYQELHSPFALSSFDGTTSPIYSSANEIGVHISQSILRLFRESSGISCSDAHCRLFTAASHDWFHFALTWNVTSGEAIWYKNGVQVHRATKSGAFVTPPVQNGVCTLGQEPDAFVADYDEIQAADGVLDEFRLWDVVRTPQQVLAHHSRSITAAAPGLVTAYNFDGGSGNVVDTSGSGNTGLLGSLPLVRNVLTYSTQRSPGPPTPPQYVASTAPLTGSGSVRRVLAQPEVSAGSAVVELPAVDRDGGALTVTITAPPAAGTLTAIVGGAGGVALTAGSVVVDAGRQQTKRVLFTLPTPFTTQTFSYSVSDGTSTATATVTVTGYTPPQAVSHDVRGAEDELLVVTLGTASAQGAMLPAVIKTLPAAGTLYQAAFGSGALPTYSNLQQDTAQLTAITAADTVVTDQRGLVLFKPAPDASGGADTAYAAFTYAVRDESSATDAAGVTSSQTVESAAATVRLFVLPVNDAPTGTAQTVTVAAGGGSSGGVDITLRSTDPDTNFAAHPFYRFTTLPRFGSLMQVPEAGPAAAAAASGSTAGGGGAGVPVPAGVEPPTVISWVSRALASSSQFSTCGPVCYSQAACPASCTSHGWHANQIEGPFDVYPRYGDIKQAWQSTAGDNPAGEWIEVEFSQRLFLSKVEIFEIFNGGAVTRLSVTDTYRGGDTTWHTVWSGPAQLGLPPSARIFSPSVCPLRLRVAAMRLFLQTDAIASWQNLDAVRVTGSLTPPIGSVSHTGGKVRYVPAPGIHSAPAAAASSSSSGGAAAAVAPLDVMAFTATDCEATSAVPAPISVSVLPPAAASLSDTVWRSRTVAIDTDTPVALALDTHGVRAALSAADGVTHTVSSAPVSVKIAAILVAAGATAPTLTQSPPVAAGAVGGNVTAADIAAVSAGAALPTGSSLSQPQLSGAGDNVTVTLPASTGDVTLLLWATVNGVTFRESLLLTPRCTGRAHRVEAAHLSSVTPTTSDAATPGAAPVSGACIPCERIPASQLAALSASERLLFDSKCVRDFAPNTALRGVLTAATIVALLLSLSNLAAVLLLRRSPPMKFASWRFCALMLVGSILSLTVPLIAAAPPSDLGCIMQPVVGHLGFALCFGSLFAKTYRIMKLFNNKKMSRRVISDAQLGRVVAAVVAAVMGSVLLSLLTAPPRPVTERVGNTRQLMCRASGGGPVALLPLLLELCLLLYGVSLCVRNREAPSAFNENKYIALSIYNIFFVGILVLPLVLLLATDPDTEFLFTTAGLVFVNLVSMLALFLPKYHAIFTGAKHMNTIVSQVAPANTLVVRDYTHTSGGGGGGGSGFAEEEERLRAENATLRARISAMEQQQ